MAKKIGLRIANNVDTTKVFSAKLCGGGRGIDHETMALESHSNDVCPTIRTITNFVLICEPMKEETNKEPKICAMRGRSDGKWHESEHEQRIECRYDGVTNTITGVSKDCLVVEPKRGQKEMGVLEFCDNHVKVKTATKDGTQQMEYGGVCDIAYPNSETRRGRIQEGGSVSPTLTCESRDAQCVPEMPFRVRRLSERELFRLMDVSEEDIDKIQAAGISKTQQAKMAGNSIVVSCLYHIFRKMFIDTEQEERQMTLF